MYNICSFSDYGYLIYGLALYESIKKTTDDFTLHYLCLDNKTYDKIKDIKNICPYHINDFKNDRDVIKLKEKESCKGGFSLFHFTTTPLWIHKCIFDLKLEEVLYADSDIFFYNNISDIFDYCRPKSIGLAAHKTFKKGNSKPGFYNVGVLYFKNDKKARRCLEWWKYVNLNDDNKWKEEYGSCGDQKYLEVFDQMIPNDIALLDKKFGHVAPWNFHRIQVFDDYIIWSDHDNTVWRKKKTTQKLYFSHFSHFIPKFSKNTYTKDRRGEYGEFLQFKGAKKLYDDYFEILKDVKGKYIL